MTPAEFRSILEVVGHGDDGDAGRALSKSRSMIQKMKKGDAPVQGDVAATVEALQDAYADSLEAALESAPVEIQVWADNESSWAATGRPARWWRMIAAACRQEHGTRIVYLDQSDPTPAHDPTALLDKLS